MRNPRNLFFLFFLIVFSASSVLAKQASVSSLQHLIGSDHSRLVFELSDKVAHNVFLLNNPPRLVVDLKNAGLSGSLLQPKNNHPHFDQVRSASRNRKDLRVVVDLKTSGRIKTSEAERNNGRGHQLIVDLYPSKSNTNKKSNRTVQPVNISKISYNPKKTVKAVRATHVASNRYRDVIVAIDAGHGGIDPGAHGPHGTHEKHVTFQIAKKLANMINAAPGMKAVLVRKGDYFIELRKRMEIARKAKADLFISIHADAFNDASVRGASVFTLSNRGATSEAARWLAKHENDSDFVGGVNRRRIDETLASVLLDLSQTATQEASVNVAGNVLQHLKSVGKLHQRSVQQAGFMVLKSPDVPSILVETAFISNPEEERNLLSRRHQEKLARAIFKGVQSYFKYNAPAQTRIASNNQRHIISRGETLSGIAEQYGISMNKIKTVNALNNNRIKIGQVLYIPADS